MFHKAFVDINEIEDSIEGVQDIEEKNLKNIRFRRASAGRAHVEFQPWAIPEAQECQEKNRL